MKNFITILVVMALATTAGNAAIHNVKDYGAVGNGAADDTAAIQSAINAATATLGRGEAVYFPAGVYKLTSTLTIPTTSQGVNLEGEGRTRTMLYRNTDYGDTLTIGTSSNAFIENVNITGLFFYHDYGGFENGHPPSSMVNIPERLPVVKWYCI